MNKAIKILLVIALVLALTAAGVGGYIWYRSTHVFVDGDAYPMKAQSLDLREKDISIRYFDQLQAQLPGCDILWNVPFQGGRVQSDAQDVTMTAVSKEEVAVLAYFPNLKAVSAIGCTDYPGLEALKAERPDLEVKYQVDLGGTALAPDAVEAELSPGAYTFEALKENLQYLTSLESLVLKTPELSLEQIDELKAAYEDMDIVCTVELMGREWDTETKTLDLTDLDPAEAASAAEKLAMLPQLETVELSAGESRLSMADVKTLRDAAPEVQFHYAFDFFGDTISTTDQEVYIKNKQIGDDNLDQVRQALDIMDPACQRFVLENCKISNEEMAKLREEYRGRVKVVWRVYFSEEGSCLTDREVIKAVYGLTDRNSQNLKYCEDARFCDFGHNELLFDCSFVAGMPNLEAIILSGSPIKSIDAFKDHKKLKFLELAFCGYIEDLSPLASCENLEMLNVSATKVSDITPVMDLPLKYFSAKNPKFPEEQQEEYEEKNPDCWSSFQKEGDAVQPYGQGWRYDKENKALPYYEMLRSKEVFYYDGPIMNTTRW
ncbi:MAG: hypothetical protein Q4F17_00505 [Eubacteriales bacterium]|nr:hypothetical protein [Eubacteriales bacterium]